MLAMYPNMPASFLCKTYKPNGWLVFNLPMPVEESPYMC